MVQGCSWEVPSSHCRELQRGCRSPGSLRLQDRRERRAPATPVVPPGGPWRPLRCMRTLDSAPGPGGGFVRLLALFLRPSPHTHPGHVSDLPVTECFCLAPKRK